MPISINKEDFIICAGRATGTEQSFTVPSGIELYSLQPVDTGMSLPTVSAVVGLRSIDRLVQLRKDMTVIDLSETAARPSRNPDTVSDVRLSALTVDQREQIEPHIPAGMENVVLLDKETTLSEFLSRKETQARGSVRVFWLACEFGEDGLAVVHNGLAIGYSASAHARRRGSKSLQRAAADSLKQALLHPDDTAGAMMAVAMSDPSMAVQAKPIATPEAPDEDESALPENLNEEPQNIRLGVTRAEIVRPPKDLGPAPKGSSGKSVATAVATA